MRVVNLHAPLSTSPTRGLFDPLDGFSATDGAVAVVTSSTARPAMAGHGAHRVPGPIAPGAPGAASAPAFGGAGGGWSGGPGALLIGFCLLTLWAFSRAYVVSPRWRPTAFISLLERPG